MEDVISPGGVMDSCYTQYPVIRGVVMGEVCLQVSEEEREDQVREELVFGVTPMEA